MTHGNEPKRPQLEKEGWTRQFTIEEHRVSEYVELYESLGHEVRVEPVEPSDLEMEECQACYAADCEKYRTIYTRPKQRKENEGGLKQEH
ncbi:MAG: hypothetical protein ACE5R6_05115 [Candidatus Heimdallarchaeota archaeon]